MPWNTAKPLDGDMVIPLEERDTDQSADTGDQQGYTQDDLPPRGHDTFCWLKQHCWVCVLADFQFRS
eukprot:879804-Pelagomonas_calceolata.AAC.3